MKALGLIARMVAALASVVSFTLSAAIGLPLWLKMANAVGPIAVGFVK